MDRGAWWTIVYRGLEELDTTEAISQACDPETAATLLSDFSSESLGSLNLLDGRAFKGY